MAHSIAVGSDWRRHQRFPTNFEAAMIVDRKHASVVVGDISSNGAMVRAPKLPRVGTEIVLAGKAFEIVATVAWRTGESCGLSFHREVDPLEIVRQNVKGLERFRKMQGHSIGIRSKAAIRHR